MHILFINFCFSANSHNVTQRASIFAYVFFHGCKLEMILSLNVYVCVCFDYLFYFPFLRSKYVQWNFIFFGIVFHIEICVCLRLIVCQYVLTSTHMGIMSFLSFFNASSSVHMVYGLLFASNAHRTCIITSCILTFNTTFEIKWSNIITAHGMSLWIWLDYTSTHTQIKYHISLISFRIFFFESLAVVVFVVFTPLVVVFRWHNDCCFRILYGTCGIIISSFFSPTIVVFFG